MSAEELMKLKLLTLSIHLLIHITSFFCFAQSSEVSNIGRYTFVAKGDNEMNTSNYRKVYNLSITDLGNVVFGVQDLNFQTQSVKFDIKNNLYLNLTPGSARGLDCTLTRPYVCNNREVSFLNISQNENHYYYFYEEYITVDNVKTLSVKTINNEIILIFFR